MFSFYAVRMYTRGALRKEEGFPKVPDQEGGYE